MELKIKFTDNLNYELRQAELYHENRLMFYVSFAKGCNSRSIGRYSIHFNGKSYFTMGGSISFNSYSKYLIEGLAEMGLKLCKEQVKEAFENRQQENINRKRIELKQSIKEVNKTIEYHQKQLNQFNKNKKDMVSELKRFI